MFNLRLAFLSLYYHATRTMRKPFVRRWQLRSCVPMTVLMYHHVATEVTASWMTSLRAIRRHVEWLRHHADVVSLEEIQHRLKSGNSRSYPCVAITFDDGYAANLSEAIPLLLDAGMPFTFFVTVSNLLNGEPFQHDLERGEPSRPLCRRELCDLAAAGVEIGSHGLTHVEFSSLDVKELGREITESKMILEDILGQPVRSLAVPYGQPRHMTPDLFRMAREAGYDRVCSAYGGYNIPGQHWFHIRRFHGDDPLIRLLNRVTLDPRLVWQTLYFDPVLNNEHVGLIDSAENQLGLVLSSCDFPSERPKSSSTGDAGAPPMPVVGPSVSSDTTEQPVTNA